MEIKQKLIDYFIKRKTIEIPHEGRTLEVELFSRGLGSDKKYTEVVENRIKESNLEILSSHEIASVMHEGMELVRMKDEKKRKIGYEIDESTSDLLEPTINFYLPKSNEEISNGVIIDLKPSFKFKKIDKNSLSRLTYMLVNERERVD